MTRIHKTRISLRRCLTVTVWSLGLFLPGELSGLAHAGVVYDVAKDFSITSNPNGVWSYGYETSLGSSLQLYDEPMTEVFGAPGLQAWLSSQVQASLAPNVFYNSTASDITYGGSARLAAHSVSFHPGPDGEYSVIRWTAPTAGTYYLCAVNRVRCWSSVGASPTRQLGRSSR